MLLLMICSIDGEVLLNSSADRAGVGMINLLSDSPEIYFYNPTTGTYGIAVGYSKPFSFEELEVGNISYQAGFKNFHYGISENYLLSSYFSRYITCLSLGYNFDAGVITGINLKHIFISETEKYNDYTADIAILYKKDRFNYTISTNNILITKSNKLNLNRIVETEVSYKINKYSSVGFGVEKESNIDMTAKCGIKYAIFDNFKMLLGYRIDPNSLSAGFNYLIDNYQLSYAITTHDELDPSHYISLIYVFE